MGERQAGKGNGRANVYQTAHYNTLQSDQCLAPGGASAGIPATVLHPWVRVCPLRGAHLGPSWPSLQRCCVIQTSLRATVLPSWGLGSRVSGLGSRV